MVDLNVMAYFKFSLPTRNWDIAFGKVATVTASLARYCAEDTLRGLSPVLSAKWVFHIPSMRALAFIASMKVRWPPDVSRSP